MSKSVIGFYIFLLIVSPPLLAQKDFAAVDLGKQEPGKVAVIPDNVGNICIFYKDLKYYYFSLINPEGKIIRTRSFKQIFRGGDMPETYIGATITEHAFILFFVRKPSYRYSSYYISKSDSNDFKVNETDLLGRGNKFVRGFTDSKYTYAVTTNRKNKQITFIRFVNEKEIKSYSYYINKDIYNYIQKDDFTLVKNNQIYTVPLTSAHMKMYLVEPDKVIYTFDNPESMVMEEGCGKTNVLEFDFLKDTLSLYSIPEKNKGYENAYSNSFYYKGKLFRIQLLADQIGLYIIDVKTGKLEKKYEYEKNASIELISHEVVTKGENTFMWMSEGNRTLETDAKIFKKLSQGIPSISVKSYQGDTLISVIGSLNIIKNTTNPGMMVTHSGGSPTYTPAILGEITSTFTTWFNSFLTDSTYRIVPKLIADPEFYKIDKYKEMLNIQGKKISTSVPFRIGDKIYLGYILKKENIFRIVEII